MQRWAFSLLSVSLIALAGCDFTPYSYSATGRVLDSTGTPLKEVRICVFAPESPDNEPTPRPFVHVVPSTLPSWVDDQFLMERSVICDQYGVYSLTFHEGLDEHQWFRIHEAPQVPDVYVFVKVGLTWRSVLLDLSPDCQEKTYLEGRIVNLPDAVFPHRGKSP
jgi:hypothetical protein